MWFKNGDLGFFFCKDKKSGKNIFILLINKVVLSPQIITITCTMIHPKTELKFISPEIGYGLVATEFIPKGTITWIYDDFDRTFKPEQVAAMRQIHKDIIRKYSYRDNKGSYVLCWDHARFVNHSFNSNCISTAYNFELAVLDIQAGEELTDDYGYLNVSEPFDCIEEADSMRRQVLPDDLLNFHGIWDEKLIDSFRYFNKVEQPFMDLIQPEFRDKVMAIANGTAVMDSILTCYCNVKEEVFVY